VKTFGWIALCVQIVGAMAAGGEATNKTVVTSDRLSFDYKRSIAVFEGNVVVADPRLRIEADKLTVIFTRSNDVSSVTAQGNVRLRSEDKTGTCDMAVYLAEGQQVELTGKAVLEQGRNSVRGERITFYLNDDRVVCKPGELVIFTEGRSLQPGRK